MQLFRKDRPLVRGVDLIAPSFALLKQHIWPVLYLGFIPGLIATMGLVLTGAQDAVPGQPLPLTDRTATGLLLVLLGAIWSGLAFPGLLVLQLRAIRGEDPSAMECFKEGLRHFIPLAFMAILVVFLIFMGLIALMIPGLILIRGFYLAQFYLIDQNLDPVKALRKSYADSKPNAGFIWETIGIAVMFAFIGYFFGKLPVVGYILSLAAGYIFLFGPALRYGEITESLKHPLQTNPEDRRP